jgi:hypothetical protein
MRSVRKYCVTRVILSWRFPIRNTHRCTSQSLVEQCQAIVLLRLWSYWLGCWQKALHYWRCGHFDASRSSMEWAMQRTLFTNQGIAQAIVGTGPSGWNTWPGFSAHCMCFIFSFSIFFQKNSSAAQIKLAGTTPLRRRSYLERARCEGPLLWCSQYYWVRRVILSIRLLIRFSSFIDPNNKCVFRIYIYFLDEAFNKFLTNFLSLILLV